LVAGEMKGTFRNLMAEKAEGFVDCRTQRKMIVSLRQWRGDNRDYHQQRKRSHRRPNKIRREGVALGVSNPVRGAIRNF
jgi:hypothetical protein